MIKSMQDLLGQKEFWVFLFILGWVLLNWPLIELADGYTVLGMPAILVYVASIWLFFILALYLFDRGNYD
jgi:TRAP-type C4-dicarboxylate transport system permease small subunit